MVHEDPDATWVELTTSGLSPGETYAVWLVETGTETRAPMGTFTAVDGDLYISLYSTLPRDRAGSIGVSDADGIDRDGSPAPARLTLALTSAPVGSLAGGWPSGRRRRS